MYMRFKAMMSNSSLTAAAIIGSFITEKKRDPCNSYVDLLHSRHGTRHFLPFITHSKYKLKPLLVRNMAF